MTSRKILILGKCEFFSISQYARVFFNILHILVILRKIAQYYKRLAYESLRLVRNSGNVLVYWGRLSM